MTECQCSSWGIKLEGAFVSFLASRSPPSPHPTPHRSVAMTVQPWAITGLASGKATRCHDPLVAGCPLLQNNPQSEAGYFYLLLRADPARCLAGRKPRPFVRCCWLLLWSSVLRTTQNFLPLLRPLTQTGPCLCDRPCLPSLVSLLVGEGPEPPPLLLLLWPCVQ